MFRCRSAELNSPLYSTCLAQVCINHLMTRIPGFSYVHPIACALTDMSIEKKGGEKRRREGGGGGYGTS